MLIFRLAYRNIIGAGLRTWLNVIVLSISYVLIIWHQGIFSGMLYQGTKAMIEDEIAAGQFWHPDYDPYDVLSLDDSHGLPPSSIQKLIDDKHAVPILIRQAAIFPEGRLQSVLLKGIDVQQKVLNMPTKDLALALRDTEIPILVGQRMAHKTGLKIGDTITIRWRDANGTFDATEGTIVSLFKSDVPTIDLGQLWVPLTTLQKMTGLPGEATLVTLSEDTQVPSMVGDWTFRSQDFLMKDIIEMVQGKRVFSVFLYAILLFMAMLGIFDTQILAIFRRRREIGMLMALGMTRYTVVALFTLEGIVHGVLALGLGAIYGTPLLAYTANHGIPLPQQMENYGFALSTKLIPVYSLLLVMTTVSIIMLTVTIVSYLPVRQIASIQPTDALRGKLS